MQMPNPMQRINEVPNLQQFAQAPNQSQQQTTSQQPMPLPSQKQRELSDDNNKKFSYPDAGGDDGQGDGNQDEGFEEARGRRRSKNDVDGRDHKCKYCDKTYLSYPALYTHTKQKHSTGPDGEQRAPPTSGRGRGRPRKNVICSHLTNHFVDLSEN